MFIALQFLRLSFPSNLRAMLQETALDTEFTPKFESMHTSHLGGDDVRVYRNVKNTSSRHFADTCLVALELA